MRKLMILLMIIPTVLASSIQVTAAERTDRVWQDESVYKLKVDRFMNGDTGNDEPVDPNDPDSYHGGDLQGVIDQLDYVKELGFTAIELSPIMSNSENGYHGYWVDDFRSVEEHFGTMADAKRLVEEAHAKDMKVILDFPVSYVSQEHPWITDPNKESWFLGQSEASKTNLWQQGLPELDTSQPEVRDYLAETAAYWAEETGVDGFRLETSSNVDQSLYEAVSEEVQSSEFVLFTNTIPENNLVSEGIVDGFADQSYQETIRSTFKQPTESSEDLYQIYEQNQERFSSDYQAFHSIDDGTDQRFTHLSVIEGQNPVTRWKLALTYLFTSPGVPVMNYGTEVPLDDGGNIGDIPMMNFKKSDEQIKQRIETLTSMRNQFPALTRGDFQQLYNEEGLAVYQRTFEDETMLIAINNAEETKVTEIDTLKDDQQMRGLLQDGIVRQQSDGTYRLGMERETADVFIIEPDKGFNWLFIGFVGGVLGLFVFAVTAISIKNRKS